MKRGRDEDELDLSDGNKRAKTNDSVNNNEDDKEAKNLLDLEECMWLFGGEDEEEIANENKEELEDSNSIHDNHQEKGEVYRQELDSKSREKVLVNVDRAEGAEEEVVVEEEEYKFYSQETESEEEMEIEEREEERKEEGEKNKEERELAWEESLDERDYEQAEEIQNYQQNKKREEDIETEIDLDEEMDNRLEERVEEDEEGEDIDFGERSLKTNQVEEENDKELEISNNDKNRNYINNDNNIDLNIIDKKNRIEQGGEIIERERDNNNIYNNNNYNNEIKKNKKEESEEDDEDEDLLQSKSKNNNISNSSKNKVEEESDKQKKNNFLEEEREKDKNNKMEVEKEENNYFDKHKKSNARKESEEDIKNNAKRKSEEEKEEVISQTKSKASSSAKNTKKGAKKDDVILFDVGDEVFAKFGGYWWHNAIVVARNMKTKKYTLKWEGNYPDPEPNIKPSHVKERTISPYEGEVGDYVEIFSRDAWHRVTVIKKATDGTVTIRYLDGMEEDKIQGPALYPCKIPKPATVSYNNNVSNDKVLDEVKKPKEKEKEKTKIKKKSIKSIIMQESEESEDLIEEEEVDDDDEEEDDEDYVEFERVEIADYNNDNKANKDKKAKDREADQYNQKKKVEISNKERINISKHVGGENEKKKKNEIEKKEKKIEKKDDGHGKLDRKEKVDVKKKKIDVELRDKKREHEVKVKIRDSEDKDVRKKDDVVKFKRKEDDYLTFKRRDDEDRKDEKLSIKIPKKEKPILPEGWIAIPSQSRAGEYSYQNRFTGQKQQKIPTAPAVQAPKATKWKYVPGKIETPKTIQKVVDYKVVSGGRFEVPLSPNSAKEKADKEEREKVEREKAEREERERLNRIKKLSIPEKLQNTRPNTTSSNSLNRKPPMAFQPNNRDPRINQSAPKSPTKKNVIDSDSYRPYKKSESIDMQERSRFGEPNILAREKEYDPFKKFNDRTFNAAQSRKPPQLPLIKLSERPQLNSNVPDRPRVLSSNRHPEIIAESPRPIPGRPRPIPERPFSNPPPSRGGFNDVNALDLWTAVKVEEGVYWWNPSTGVVTAVGDPRPTARQAIPVQEIPPPPLRNGLTYAAIQMQRQQNEKSLFNANIQGDSSLFPLSTTITQLFANSNRDPRNLALKSNLISKGWEDDLPAHTKPSAVVSRGGAMLW